MRLVDIIIMFVIMFNITILCRYVIIVLLGSSVEPGHVYIYVYMCVYAVTIL